MVTLKWKKSDRPGYQVTQCGRYWVERDPAGGHFNRWHAHREDVDEQLKMDGFPTREEAKAYCQQDAEDEAKTYWFDLWFYRENVGWWLEDDGLGSHAEVDRAIARFRAEQAGSDWSKIVLMVLPSGKTPSDYAPKFRH